VREADRVLVLNADLIPLHLMPLSTISWQEAIRLIYQDKATTIEYQGDRVVRGVNITMRIPSVIVLREFKYFKKYAKLNKYNIKLRDQFTCQYCAKKISHKSLTIDHIKPKAYGGKNEWENVVAACKPCNSNKKDDKSIVPKRKPRRPTYHELAKKLLKHERNTNEHWQQYIRLGT